MSEREFDLYLNLLGRFLGLTSDQRTVIADELRDHLETRLEELIATGMSRDAAIEQALAEFGDAAELAHHFKYLAHLRRRKWIMRTTVGTIITTAAALLLGFAMWPISSENVRTPIRTAHAQARGDIKADANASSENLNKEIEKNLATKTLKVEFVDTPLRDVLAYFGDILEIDILLDPRVDELGIDQDTPITLTLNKRPIRARTALELGLRKIHPELDFRPHDGVLLITGPNDSYVTEVYNIAGLIKDVKLPAVVEAPASAEGGNNPFGPPLTPPDQLRQVLMSTIAPNSWSEAGGSGSANVFGTLLVIKNSSKVHREIGELLTMMEKAMKDGQAKGK